MLYFRQYGYSKEQKEKVLIKTMLISNILNAWKVLMGNDNKKCLLSFTFVISDGSLNMLNKIRLWSICITQFFIMVNYFQKEAKKKSKKSSADVTGRPKSASVDSVEDEHVIEQVRWILCKKKQNVLSNKLVWV